MIPYIDPKMFNRRKNNENSIKSYKLNEKSDVYSVGMLLWEISSGRPPFYVEGERYDVGLVYDILEGLKETIVLDTPEDYVNIYTGKCNAYINFSSNCNNIFFVSNLFFKYIFRVLE